MIEPSAEVAAFCIDILASSQMERQKNAIQHGTTTVWEHSLSVANACASLAYALPFRFHVRALVRAALLHDYFLYDWHDRATSRPHHATRHGSYARENAERDFSISAHEGDIIESHMFPLAEVPRTREAWMVCLVDKIISVQEVFASLQVKLMGVHG
ncbi:HD domain-containing protein [Coriobacteriales bacterium OH1046]|nr:HD domain-containing protein [Coriobacteriales bacterium OH1046]